VKYLILILILVTTAQAGTFDRSVKLSPDGLILDHRPLGHNKPGLWVTVAVDNDLPLTLNDMISSKCGRVNKEDGKFLKFPDVDTDWRIKLRNARKPRVTRRQAIQRALRNRLTELEIEAARLELVAEAAALENIE